MQCSEILEEEYRKYWDQEVEAEFPDTISNDIRDIYLGFWFDGHKVIASQHLMQKINYLEDIGFESVDDVYDVFYPYEPLLVYDILDRIHVDDHADEVRFGGSRIFFYSTEVPVSEIEDGILDLFSSNTSLEVLDGMDIDDIVEEMNVEFINN